jgi:NAD-dependent dihydropyrimidine dehydrogenase PreA subunit
MVESKEEVKALLREMLEDFDGKYQNDTKYREDMKEVGILKVQYEICGFSAYQIFEVDNYSYKFGEKLNDEPDITLIIENRDLAARFLRSEHIDTTFGKFQHGTLEILHTAGWEINETETGKSRDRISVPFLKVQLNKKKRHNPLIFAKLPIFRVSRKESEKEGENYGSYIPVNKSLGTFENQILPEKVFKYFIDKASHIVIRTCGCRLALDCKDHDKSLGCMYMGDDTLKMVIPEEKGRFVTKEEALERVRLAIDDGLIPLIGRAMGETESYGIEDTGHFLSCCFCCSCCCANGKMATYGPSTPSKIYHRMEGINVNVDKEICKGCGECVKVCVFRGREIIEGKAVVDQERCLGCGRCETTCPEHATSIEINDMDRIYKLIGKIESLVDVQKQDVKV